MMSIQSPFTIEQFYKYLADGKLMAGKCQKCEKIHLPPRPICDNCYNQTFQWLPVTGKGRLVTYTVIHISPPQFQSLAPYAVGIVQLEGGLKLPGMISGVSTDALKIGLELAIDFKACTPGQCWPNWGKYCFRPA